MTDYVRNFCVSEFNRLLPMVRGMLIREKKERLLQGDYEFQKGQLKAVDKKLELCYAIKEMLPDCITELPVLRKKALEQITSHEEKKKEYSSRIEENESIIEEYSCMWAFDSKFCKTIISFIVSVSDNSSADGMNGFLRAEDLQEEYLVEYIYLLVMEGSFSPTLRMDTLFEDSNAKSAFYDMVNKNCSTEQATILEAIEKQEANRHLFFKLF